MYSFVVVYYAYLLILFSVFVLNYLARYSFYNLRDICSRLTSGPTLHRKPYWLSDYYYYGCGFYTSSTDNILQVKAHLLLPYNYCVTLKTLSDL